jgi:Ras-related protein Rab-18
MIWSQKLLTFWFGICLCLEIVLLRFTDNDFNELQPSTIGVDFKVKMLTLGGKNIKATIWDTAGQERFRTLTNSYYRGAQGIVLVYDVTRRDSFENINEWLREVMLHKPRDQKDMILVLCGNKVDLENKREVSAFEGEAWARRNGMIFIEVSAKTKLGIQQVRLCSVYCWIFYIRVYVCLIYLLRFEQVFNEMVVKILDSPSVVNASVSRSNRGDTADLTQAVESSENGCCFS